MRIAHLSTFPGMRCGIAFYTADLIDALPEERHAKYVLHYGKNLTPDAAGDANVTSYASVRALARTVSRSSIDVISLQHEFGIWGGDNGEHLIDFLDHTTKPIIATLHTTFKRDARPAIQSVLLRQLVERSTTSFVLSGRSRDTLLRALDLTSEVVAIVPHGVPDTPFVRRAAPNGRQPWRFCSIGFFRPNKGIEEALQALAAVKKAGVAFRFVMAGSPQPQFLGQATYLQRLEALVAELGLHDNVRFRRAFLSRGQQLSLIQDSHAGVFAYQDPDQSSSGTVPLVLAAGRPVVCTPFEFAQAKRRELGDAITVAAGFDARSLSQALLRHIAAGHRYERMSTDLYAATRLWLWKTVGRTYAAAFAGAKATRSVAGRSQRPNR